MENWYHLGLQLGVSENILDNIEYDHRGDVQTCKRKMVQTWLKQPRPSWNVLVESLSRVGEECAAVEALKNNAVGKLMYLNVNKLTHRFFVRHQLYYIILLTQFSSSRRPYWTKTMLTWRSLMTLSTSSLRRLEAGGPCLPPSSLSPRLR